ncbi:MAG: hypothetical protein MUC85_06340 [Anaerolineales bacterium]|jgi:hypothetical protein|nr:hypothetical protein [Anaerolineales bacterium]
MFGIGKWIFKSALVSISILLLLALFVQVQTAFAQEPVPLSENNNCVICHENLYLLHDTGNYFCLCESPMTCVACHGGDPTAVKKEDAHAFRNPHPVIGNDVSRCATCHPEESSERAAIFDQKAGISNVLIVPTIPPSTGQAAVMETKIGTEIWRVLLVLLLILGSIGMGVWINREYHPA